MRNETVEGIFKTKQSMNI